MLEIVAHITTAQCRFELLQAEWPAPVEFQFASDKPVLSSLLASSTYKAEGRLRPSGQRNLGVMGKTFMLPPDRELLGRGTGGPLRIARCIFERDTYCAHVREADRLTEAQLTRALDVNSLEINHYMRRLVREALNPDCYSEIMLDGLSTAILIEFNRFITDPETTSTNSHLSSEQLSRIEKYINSMETVSPSIKEIAELCGLSPQYFSKKFSKATGQSIRKYISGVRFGRAQQLLRDTAIPLKEVAFQAGFSSPANFSAAFKAATGCTPAQYRSEASTAGFSAL